MTEKEGNQNLILQKLLTKSVAKQIVYQNTYDTFQDLKLVAKELAQDTKNKLLKTNKNISVEYKGKGEFTAELKFAGDLLCFTMHSNVFEFPRDHVVMKTSYVKDDPLRSYCGVILIYNFLADSFKYNRMNDVGYLVARIFINKEFHYFVEGKRQIGFLYNNFISEVVDKNALRRILETAVNYCIDFDLLTPPYNNIKEATVQEMIENTYNMNLRTGKRLGFRFQADQDEANQ